MAPARFLAIVFGVFVASFALWSAYAASEFGRYTRAGYASCAYIDKKLDLARNVASPKLVVMAGSSGALGIKIGDITNALPVRGFNFALVATFSPGFQLFQARKFLHRGDAVLLAFEYLAYDYGAPTNGQMDAVYSCGEDYWRSLDWPDKLFFVFALRPQRYFSTRAIDDRMRTSVGDVVAKSVLANGDAGDAMDGPDPDANSHQPLVVRFIPASNGARQTVEFVAWAKANGVTVLATWPNTLYFKQYESQPAFTQIAEFYRSLGVEVIGQPQDAMLGSEYLADTIYHLNKAGIAIRTGKLIENLKKDPAFAAWQNQARISE
jgi:hypothetical protein